FDVEARPRCSRRHVLAKRKIRAASRILQRFHIAHGFGHTFKDSFSFLAMPKPGHEHTKHEEHKNEFLPHGLPLLRRIQPAAPNPLTTHKICLTACYRRNAGSKHMDASVSVSFCPPTATASAEGERSEKLNGRPSRWDRARTRMRVLATRA